MESSTSKADIIIKPVLLKAGIPLALSVAGFICAKIVANPSVNLKGSSLEIDDQVCSLETNSPKFRYEDGLHSFSSTCMHSTECLEIQDNKRKLEEEISRLRIRLDELQKRESELELQFIRYCDLKEQESVLMEGSRTFGNPWRTRNKDKGYQETGELRALLEQLQDEKKGLLAKLGLAEKSASSVSKIEKGIQIEDYTLQASKRS
ncbi:hypothetical protein COP1_014648 [Malus domestica]